MTNDTESLWGSMGKRVYGEKLWAELDIYNFFVIEHLNFLSEGNFPLCES